MKTKITRHIARLFAVAAKDDTYPSLNGVYVEQGEKETKFTATDGHILLSAITGNEGNGLAAFIIPRQLLMRFVRAHGSDSNGKGVYHAMEVEQAADRVTGVIDTPGVAQTLSTEAITEAYVDYRRALQTDEPVFEFHLAADILIQFADIIKTMCAKREPIKFRFVSPLEPIAISTTARGGEELTGAIMPCRGVGEGRVQSNEDRAKRRSHLVGLYVGKLKESPAEAQALLHAFIKELREKRLF